MAQILLGSVLSYQVSILYALGLYSLSMKMCMNCDLMHECYKQILISQ